MNGVCCRQVPMVKSSAQNPFDTPGVRFPPPLIFIIVFVAGLQLQRIFPVIDIPKVIGRLISAVCFVASAILAASSFIMFRRAHTSPLPFKPTSALVTNGPYRFSRNPMYLSLVLLYVGLALWRDIFWVLVLAPIAVVLVQYLAIVREERYLERKFGQKYLIYKARVRRWL
jgi:protein-S-isoprenylcysteine O-methyltransferase Ste14